MVNYLVNIASSSKFTGRKHFAASLLYRDFPKHTFLQLQQYERDMVNYLMNIASSSKIAVRKHLAAGLLHSPTAHQSAYKLLEKS